MQWSPGQQKAIDTVGRWINNRGDQQCFRLFGPAGTGKTSLARHLSESAGTVLFATYTGKAAHVLQAKGCPGASTIHSLIYQPIDNEAEAERIKEMEERLAEMLHEARMEGRDPKKAPEIRTLEKEIAEEKLKKKGPQFSLRYDTPLRDADLLVIDECSMVDERIGRDLMSFGTPILVLGDPAQLPPVRGGGFFTDDRPDVLLTDVHRQALDNPILRLATAAREGGGIALGDYGASSVVARGDVSKEMALGADQILVGRNKTRRGMNHRMRALLLSEPGPHPVSGDKVVCLKNNHELGLLNGSLWKVAACNPPEERSMVLSIDPLDFGQAQAVVAHDHYFLDEEPPFWEARSAEHFDYGYALTVHKSQGSEWQNVLLFDESGCFRENARRWLYTAITRASERIVIAR